MEKLQKARLFKKNVPDIFPKEAEKLYICSPKN